MSKSTERNSASLKSLKAEIWAHPQDWKPGLIFALVTLLIPWGWLSVFPLLLVSVFLVVNLCSRLQGMRHFFLLSGTLFIGTVLSVAMLFFFLATWAVPLGAIGLYGILLMAVHFTTAHESISCLLGGVLSSFFVFIFDALYLGMFSSLYVTAMAARKLSTVTS